MRTEETDTGTGKQPNPAKDGSNSSNTSESDGCSHDGSFDPVQSALLPIMDGDEELPPKDQNIQWCESLGNFK